MSYLPHIYPVGGIFFITFRLDDSIPQSALKKLRIEYEREMKQIKVLELQVDKEEAMIYKLKKKIFGKHDHQLDEKPYGHCHMKDEVVAKTIWDKIWQYHGVHYNVLALSVMPNHVHMLLDTSVQIPDVLSNEVLLNYVDVGNWMRLIKGGSAFAINKLLGRKGKLWARESYDHFARDESEIQRIRDYILNNPKKARLSAKYYRAPYLFSNV